MGLAEVEAFLNQHADAQQHYRQALALAATIAGMEWWIAIVNERLQSLPPKRLDTAS